MDNKIIHINSIEDNNLSNSNNSCNDVKSKFIKLFNKKNLKIVILAIVGVIALIIYFGMSSTEKTTTTSKAISTSAYLTTLDYCSELENRLESVLKNIKGAGQVSVMVTVDGSPELIYATDSDEKVSTNSSGTTTSSNSSSPIIVNVNGNSNALILTENLPAVKGVIVVSSGAGDVAVKLDILNAVATLLDVSTDKVSVLKGI